MVTFVFRDKEGQICAGLRTLMLQEMIRRGVLFQGVFVPCYSHTEEDIAHFAQAFADSLVVYQKALHQGYCLSVDRKVLLSFLPL
jgi:spore coat polysaccharide biosynthesis protein SpsF